MSFTFVFGGSFDPVHLGHLYLLNQLHKLSPETNCLVIPCHQSPFKNKATVAATDRLTMLQLATKQLPWIKIERYELEHPGPSYTYNTLKYLSLIHLHPILVMGSDTFATVPSWYQADELIKQVKFCVVTRNDDNPPIKLAPNGLNNYTTNFSDLITAPPGTIYLHRTNTPKISSSQIRAACRAHLSINHLVPAPVACYIYAHHLYE